MIVKNKQTAEDRAFWAYCEAVAGEVSLWPKWMRGVVESVGGEPVECDRLLRKC
jgi:hypothetical protein